MLTRASVIRPYFDWDGRKYLELAVPNQGTLRVKVPFRYGRVMCRVHGIRPIQELKQGEEVEVLLEKKIWDGSHYWVLVSITPRES